MATPRSPSVEQLLSKNGIYDLLRWKTPAFSAAAFVLCNSVFYVVQFSGHTLLSLVAFVAAMHLMFTAVFAFVRKTVTKFQGGDWEHEVTEPFLFDEGAFTETCKQAIQSVNKALGFYHASLSHPNFAVSIMVAAGLYISAQLLRFFSTISLLWIACDAVFLWPIVYSQFKSQIDAHIQLLEAQIATIGRQLSAHIRGAANGKKNN